MGAIAIEAVASRQAIIASKAIDYTVQHTIYTQAIFQKIEYKAEMSQSTKQPSEHPSHFFTPVSISLPKSAKGKEQTVEVESKSQW